jgi:hypothetical protein
LFTVPVPIQGYLRLLNVMVPNVIMIAPLLWHHSLKN